MFAAALLRIDAFSQEKKITYGAESDFNSRFVWREMVLDERSVSKNSIWLEAYGVNLELWNNVTLSYAADRSRLRSSGLDISYEREWKKFKLEPEIEVYRWQDDPGFTNTMECSIRFEYQTRFVQIFSEHAVDVIANRGGYYGEGGLRFKKEAGRKTQGALEVASGFASRKFNDFNVDVAKPALNFIRAEIAVTHNLTPHLYVRPHFDFIHVPDRQIREKLGVRNVGTFGIAVGFDFCGRSLCRNSP